MRTEYEIADALRTAAESAPEPDLLAGVAARRRTRTRRRLGMLAAVTAVAVAGAGTALARGDRAPNPGDVATTTTEWLPPGVDPVGRLWPAALSTMPIKRAEGWTYLPITALSSTEILVAVEAVPNIPRRFEIYDLSRRTTRQVTSFPPVTGTNATVREPATDGVSLVWFAFSRQKGKHPVTEFWVAPLKGGRATSIHARPGNFQTEAVAVDGENVYISQRKDGISKIKGPGTLNRPDLRLAVWPWAGDQPVGPRANQSVLVNLKTGESRKVNAPEGAKGLRCGPVWCYGLDGAGQGFAQRPDGRDHRALPGFGQFATDRPYPVLDRFVKSGRLIADLETGRTAQVPGDWADMSGNIVYWRDGETYQVLNLAAVPAAQ